MKIAKGLERKICEEWDHRLFLCSEGARLGSGKRTPEDPPRFKTPWFAVRQTSDLDCSPFTPFFLEGSSLLHSSQHNLDAVQEGVPGSIPPATSYPYPRQ